MISDRIVLILTKCEPSFCHRSWYFLWCVSYHLSTENESLSHTLLTYPTRPTLTLSYNCKSSQPFTRMTRSRHGMLKCLKVIYLRCVLLQCCAWLMRMPSLLLSAHQQRGGNSKKLLAQTYHWCVGGDFGSCRDEYFYNLY